MHCLRINTDHYTNSGKSYHSLRQQLCITQIRLQYDLLSNNVPFKHFYLFDISIEKFENSATLGYIELCLRKPINKEQVLP